MFHRSLSHIVIGLALASLLWANPLAPTPAQAYPEPSLAGTSWQLDFSFDELDAVSVNDAQGNVRWYWYLPYKVVNNTGQPRMFVPEVVAYNNLGQIKHAGRNVPAVVYPAIAKRLRNKLLLSPLDVVGQLLTGEDYAKESVAIWPASDQDVDQITIFVGGLSGETATIDNPATGQSVLLRRNLMLQFSLPGHPQTPQDQPARLTDQSDVMR